MLERLLVVFSIIALLLGAWIVVIRSADPEVFYLDDDVPNEVMEQPFADWHEFTVPEHGFRVMVPNFPTSAESDVELAGSSEPVQYKLWATQDLRGAAYSLNVIIYPAALDLSQPFDAMEAVLDDVLRGSDANVKRLIEAGDYNGLPLMTFTVEGSESKAGGHMIMKGHKLYLLIYLDVPENFNETIRDYFLDSFMLL